MERNPALVRLAVVGFVAVAAFSGFEATFALFGSARFDLTEGSTAVVFLGIGLLLVGVQGGAIGPLSAALGSGRLLRIGSVSPPRAWSCSDSRVSSSGHCSASPSCCWCSAGRRIAVAHDARGGARATGSAW